MFVIRSCSGGSYRTWRFLKEQLKSLPSHRHDRLESQVKFCHPPNISGASQQNIIAAFSSTTEADGENSTGVIQKTCEEMLRVEVVHTPQTGSALTLLA